MSIYTSSLALKGALERIETPPEAYDEKGTSALKKYEHHVSTWACTKLKEIFHDGEWAMTPEQKDRHSGKKPDLVVEKATQKAGGSVDLKIHLGMELKKRGERMEDALAQLCEAITETIDEKGNEDSSAFEVYAVVQCGLKIAFFEYHSDAGNLDDQYIPNFEGCVSLTQNYKIKGHDANAIDDKFKPNDLERLFFNSNKLKTNNSIRKAARDYPTPCVFDLIKHEKEVDAVFQYMKSHVPRSSW